MITIDKSTYSRDTYSILNAISRGLKRTCPHCGSGKVFNGYLKTQDCTNCAAPTGDIRADDLPPYLTIFLVGHIIVPMLVFVEAVYHPELWMQMAVWPSMTLLLTLLFLPFIKGGAVGLMWYLQLKGDEQR
tara:strand:- start:159317 stop:159709 length:393 start_codon:yes stop_codon:yes gene_type:complete